MNYAGQVFGNHGHRRVMAIGTGTADAQAWAAAQGITNVSDQSTAQYGHPNSSPPIGFTPLTDRASTPLFFGRTDVATLPSSGLGANFKRGSKFVLGQAGTLLGLCAYLDGSGSTTGSRQVLVELYRDSGGVPGPLVATSNTVTINSGLPPSWVNFSTSPIALTADSYWIVIHSRDTGGVARDYADGSTTNWYGNNDTFSDGGSNPFGTGTSGTTTLSVYTVFAPQSQYLAVLTLLRRPLQG